MPNPSDVGPMTSNDLRCPACSAHVPPGADWCALCFADLRPPAPPEPPEAVAPVSAPEPTPGEQVEPGQRAGKHSRSAEATGDAAQDAFDEPGAFGQLPGLGTPRDAAAIAEFDARASEMLAQLSAAEGGQPLGSWAARLESNGSRAFAAAVGVAVLVMAALLVMSLLGHFV